MTTKTVKQETKLEEFTASFLLSEFRKDIRELRSEFRNDFRDLDNKIDNRFMWMLSIQFGTLLTVIGTILTIFLKTKGV